MGMGQLVEFILYLAFFYEPVRQLHSLNQMLQAARTAGERMFDILDAPLERQDIRLMRWLLSPVRGEVVYEKVGFSYAEGNVVLKGYFAARKAGRDDCACRPNRRRQIHARQHAPGIL